jgi:hypothetical protein
MYFAFMYEDRRMKPVKIILKGGREKRRTIRGKCNKDIL